MKATTKSGRGEHLFVDGSDPILACVSRPKSLRASEVAPVHSVTAQSRRFSLCFPRLDSTPQLPKTNTCSGDHITTSFKRDRPCRCLNHPSRNSPHEGSTCGSMNHSLKQPSAMPSSWVQTNSTMLSVKRSHSSSNAMLNSSTGWPNMPRTRKGCHSHATSSASSLTREQSNDSASACL